MKPFSAFASLPGRLLLGSAAALTLLACDPDNDPTPDSQPIVTNSVYIVNEGNFTRSNAEISLFSKASSSVTNKSLFSSANGRSLGDIAQSMAVRDSLGYIVVNNSNKLEVVSLARFKSKATIENLKLPRYFVAASSEKGYVTETVSYSTASGQVSVIDLKTNKVTRSIAVGKQPEKLAVVGSRLYVTNNGDNTVTVINTTTDVVEGTITVGDGPNSVVADRNGRVWVLSSGKIVYTTTGSTRVSKGSLSQIVPGQLTATTREMPSDQSSPGRLTINGSLDQLYYTYLGGVYTLNINEATLPTKPLIKRGSFYGLGVDPQDGTIYGGLASFTASDKVIRFKSTGAAIDSFTVLAGPNGFVFY
ncbi:DUF5074 domain-containing protein [Hymenobacter actinosclerus]|uniref:40-residue YVTN family beta-propeller repeat-containing protein n=1 Tax=Hymenobacter actinosclerus TaxID=82805 RepID=A0A1H9ZUW6_9BACT|nr:DUF5074 domain-containing protein [Hymenobacter actinosclerus]SES85500.1 40-residue YVTN family beta-propeller repeat-containing protein [Hymenobacter actinosclerus]